MSHRPRFRLRTPTVIATCLLTLTLAIAGCGGSSSTTANTQPTATTPPTVAPTAAATATTSGPEADVKMSGSVGSFQFNPATITIKVGTTVVWTNSTGVPHTSTSDASSAVSWDSGVVNPGAKFSMTFTQAGTFSYHCSFHPSMLAKVIVTQ